MSYQIGFFESFYQNMLRSLYKEDPKTIDELERYISSLGASLDLENLRDAFESEDDYLMFVLKYS